MDNISGLWRCLMAVDLTKLVLHSNYPAFINNAVYTGTKTISGSLPTGTTTLTYTVTLDKTPDLLDIMFNGRAYTLSSTENRPDDGWFKRGAIGVLTTGLIESAWILTTSITGATVTISATAVNETVATETLTSTDFSYRIIDYSVFD